MLQSGGQNQKWPTNGQIGSMSPAVWGLPNTSKWGTKSEVVHKWADWLHHPCPLGLPKASERGTKSEVADKWAVWPPLPSRGSPTLQSRGQDQKWLILGGIGYINPAVGGGVPNASERGTKPEVAHKGVDWLCYPCHIWGPQRFRAGNRSP